MEIMLAIALGLSLAVLAYAVLRVRRSSREVRALRARLEQLERRAGSAQERAAAVFEALPTAALRVAADGRIVQVGRRAGRRFDFLAPGMSVLEAFGEHRLAGALEVALTSGESQDFELRLFADGRRTFRVAVEPYSVAGDAEALLLLADVSEAVAYQELRSQFVANVSHELRTPLTGLRGLLEALDDPAMDDETRADFVARCINETQRLEALIADILFLSELEATQDLPYEGVTDLTDALEEAAADLADEAGRRGVELEVNADGPAPCRLSEAMARTVVRNLIENAVKYAGPGAVARARVVTDPAGVTLSVADDGAGIPERHLPHIFERFYRADPSRSKRMGGTGLGLSIVKHIAERFGGEASATSREGFGTTVTVRLPAAAPDHSQDAGGERTDDL